jgi:predicted HTH transcriptional regulator
MLPEFPSSAPGGVFPYTEGLQWEFKETDPVAAKIRETICAMLNAAGGYIVIGVRDDRHICGLSDKMLDKHLLTADNIHHCGSIVHEDGSAVPLECFKASAVQFGDKRVACITVRPEEGGARYKTVMGEMYVRLAASNHKVRAERLYTESDINHMRAELRKEMLEAIKDHKQVLAAVNQANQQIHGAKEDVANMRKQRDFATGRAKKMEDGVQQIQKALFERILKEKAAAEERLMAEAKGCFRMVSELLCGLV